MDLLIIVVLVLLGLCFGSFVSALLWRLHEQAKPQKDRAVSDRDLSMITGRSMCSRCHHTLGVWDLLPVVSWLVLRGKCRYCHKPIEDTPFAEAGLAVLFVLVYLLWPQPFTDAQIGTFAAWLIALVSLLALTIYDLRWRLLPNKIVYPLICLAGLHVLIQAIFFGGGLHTVIQALLGLAVAGGLFYFLFQISGGRWIGGGDVKLGFALGLLLGTPGRALLMLFLASLIGTVVSLFLMYAKRVTRKSHIPFGPFLILATVIVQLFGTTLINWYLHQFLGL